MKAWEIGPRSGIGGVRLAERPDPSPGAGEVVVKMVAAGLNYRDLMVLRGLYGDELPETRIPLSDGVGIVDARGEDVASIAVGARAIAPHFLGWREGPFSPAVFGADLGVTADGWLSEYVVLPESAVVPVPDSVDDATAATLAVVGATVWHAMVDFGRAGPGRLVLAQGTGGVSIFALQLAKALGAEFAITSSRDEKLERAREMGADFTVNYRDRPDWAAALRESTDGRGADIVVDTLGFPALGETVSATAVEGRIGTIGALSGSPADPAGASQGALIAKNITLKGIASGSRAMLAKALETVAEHGISIAIDSEFPFDEAPAAFRRLDGDGHFGKLLIRA